MNFECRRFEGMKNNEGLNQARQYFDIGHFLFLIRYSFFRFKIMIIRLA